jgi:hypothetical protein
METEEEDLLLMTLMLQEKKLIITHLRRVIPFPRTSKTKHHQLINKANK